MSLPKHEPLPNAASSNKYGKAVVYVLRCVDGTLYTGWTTDLALRLRAHQAAKGAKYTRGRLPVELAGWFAAADRTEARRFEAYFKKLPRAQKLRLLKKGR